MSGGPVPGSNGAGVSLRRASPRNPRSNANRASAGDYSSFRRLDPDGERPAVASASVAAAAAATAKRASDAAALASVTSAADALDMEDPLAAIDSYLAELEGTISSMTREAAANTRRAAAFHGDTSPPATPVRGAPTGDREQATELAKGAATSANQSQRGANSGSAGSPLVRQRSEPVRKPGPTTGALYTMVSRDDEPVGEGGDGEYANSAASHTYQNTTNACDIDIPSVRFPQDGCRRRGCCRRGRHRPRRCVLRHPSRLIPVLAHRDMRH